MGRQKRILVVEDEPCCRTILTMIFRSHGYEVMEAEDGEEALSLLLSKGAKKKPFDLVVTDLQMSRITGYELLKAIKGNTINVPTMIVTGVEDGELTDKVNRMGCVAYMEKPCDFPALVDRVASILHETGQSGNPEVRG